MPSTRYPLEAPWSETRWRSQIRGAHLEIVADLSKADQKRFIAMMLKIVTKSSSRPDATASDVAAR
jgi:hypothetical protein